jgi:hypothetical protein
MSNAGTRSADRDFLERGYVVERLPIDDKLTALRQEILEVFDLYATAHTGLRVDDDHDLVTFFQEAQPLQYHAYQRLNRLPGLAALASDDSLVSLIKALGLTHPVIDVHLQIRCDMPIPEQHLAPAHQDYAHNVGSRNSVTVWIPLQSAPTDRGALRVAPGSHHHGLFPHVDGFMGDFPDDRLVSVPVAFGEALVFSQWLVHASGRNSGDQTRFTAVVRYSDLSEPEYLDREWYWNHGYSFAGHASPENHPELFTTYESYLDSESD